MTADTTPTDAKPETPEKEEKVDLRNLQDKFHGLLDQRNEYNDLSREARDARNLLNDQRREKAEALEEFKTKRDAATAKMREHKEVRNAYQDQARALIAQKKGQKGAIERSLPLQVRKLRNELQQMMERQETQVLSVEKERDLVDDARKKRAELKELEAQMEKQKALAVDLDDTDQAIDELFKKADAEHAEVEKYQGENNEWHEKFVATIKEMRLVQSEANDKHKEFIALRKKADELHNKAMELREKVMAVKGERRDRWKAQKAELRDFNERGNRRVNDPKALEKANESALEELKKGGKINLGF